MLQHPSYRCCTGEKTHAVSEQKLQAVENRKIANIASALKVANSAIMLGDLDLNVVYMNDNIQKLLSSREGEFRKALPNFSANDVMGKNDRHRQAMEAVFKAIDAVLDQLPKDEGKQLQDKIEDIIRDDLGLDDEG